MDHDINRMKTLLAASLMTESIGCLHIHIYSIFGQPVYQPDHAKHIPAWILFDFKE